jgi:hypothetical protein
MMCEACSTDAWFLTITAYYRAFEPWRQLAFTTSIQHFSNLDCDFTAGTGAAGRGYRVYLVYDYIELAASRA